MKFNEEQIRLTKSYLTFLLTLFLLLNVMDLAFTNFFILKYGVEIESNPIMKASKIYLGDSLDALIKILVGTTITICCFLWMERIKETKELLILTLGWSVINGIYIGEVLLKQLPHFFFS